MTALSPADQLKLAWTLVDIWHKDQKDKAGRPYSEHIHAVAARFTDPLEQSAAALHDIVEDTAMTLEELLNLGFDTYVVNTVDDLTRRPNETYKEYIIRLSDNPLARRIKLTDLRHNSGERLSLIAAQEPEKAALLRERYEWAINYLTAGQ